LNQIWAETFLVDKFLKLYLMTLPHDQYGSCYYK
jgi:hypothetical protein